MSASSFPITVNYRPRRVAFLLDLGDENADRILNYILGSNKQIAISRTTPARGRGMALDTRAKIRQTTRVAAGLGLRLGPPIRPRAGSWEIIENQDSVPSSQHPRHGQTNPAARNWQFAAISNWLSTRPSCDTQPNAPAIGEAHGLGAGGIPSGSGWDIPPATTSGSAGITLG